MHKDQTIHPEIEEIEGEIWKDITGYEGLYQISNIGRVKSFARSWNIGGTSAINSHPDMIITGGKLPSGYPFVSLRKNKIKKDYVVHRLVAREFVPNPENKPFVNHLNGIKDDPRSTNLEWCTHSENMQHAWDTGLMTVTETKRRAVAENGRKHCSMKVIDIATNTIYSSIKDASTATGINYHTLKDKLSGRKNARNNTTLKYFKDGEKNSL